MERGWNGERAKYIPGLDVSCYLFAALFLKMSRFTTTCRTDASTLCSHHTLHCFPPCSPLSALHSPLSAQIYSHAILTHSSISMDSIGIHMNPTIHLGFAVDALLQQKEAWSNAKDPPDKGRTQSVVCLSVCMCVFLSLSLCVPVCVSLCLAVYDSVYVSLSPWSRSCHRSPLPPLHPRGGLCGRLQLLRATPPPSAAAAAAAAPETTGRRCRPPSPSPPSPPSSPPSCN